MALRDQPYLPLYVQDFLTDEKLNECSALAHGIYIKLMCLMHKSDEYGTILLKQKYKQSTKPIENFACKLAKHFPFSKGEIIEGLTELINEKVIEINEDKIWQKRMIRDNEISLIRAEAGKKGGEKTQKFAKAKVKANSEYEYEDENINIIKYLNNKCNTNYKVNTPKTISLIRSRLKEGFTVDDFKKVIDIKSNQWLKNPEMNKFLRPETLFGNKFESYLNEKLIEKKSRDLTDYEYT